MLALGSGSAVAAGDAGAGKSKAAVCAACHGTDGNSVNPIWPSLAGQHAPYLAGQIKAIKEGKTRTNPMMAPMVASLNDQDIADLAAYFASLPRRDMAADASKKDLIGAAEKIYRGGDAARGLPACTACHGPTGAGIGTAGFPRVSQQHAPYTAVQLRAFRAGTRANDPRAMMRDVASLLSDADIEGLAEYLAGLH